MTAESLAHRLGGKRSGNGYVARCLVHEDRTASLHITEGDDGKVLVHCHAGCEQAKVLADLKSRGLWEVNRTNRHRHKTIAKTIKATYDYTDEFGALLYQAVRYEPKGFSQRRPNGAGGWIWNLAGIAPVPFRLHKILATERIAVVEGEKDVLTLESIGIPATCNSGGAGKFGPELVHWFKGKSIFILPDNDKPGRDHALQVAALRKPVAASVRIVELPDLDHKEDISDFLETGATREDLSELYADAPEWTPEWKFTTELPADEAAKEEPRTIRSLAEVPRLRSGEPGKIEYLIEPLLPVAAVVAFTGDSGSGKSSLASALARDVLATERSVLILDRENPKPVVVDRFDRLNIPDDTDRLVYWGGWLGDEPPQPASPIVIEWIKAQDPKPLVIVDSLSAFQNGDENDSKAMRTFTDQCRKLAYLGCTVVLIHHDGKADTAKDYRGSSDFKASLDAAFHVTNASEDGKLDRIRLRCFKSRFGFSGDLIYRYAGGKFLRETDEVAVAKTVSESLRELLRTNPGIGVKEFSSLASAENLGRNRASRFLDDGIAEGSIRQEKINKLKAHFLISKGTGQ